MSGGAPGAAMTAATPGTLHLVRGEAPPPGVVAAGDRVVYERDRAWHLDGAPLADEALVALVFAARRVAVW
ncbi:MAG: hypothetical protein H6708_26275 [Kofleriaceae bacterium]|nr:hypothetical protein [Kofleriaceae bacterium]